MVEETATVSEPRYWKITINPEECPSGAWGIYFATGMAMLGLPGVAGESHYAVKNLKQLREGDWLVAYTPQEGSYCVGGVGQVTRGYRCEEEPFDHPWNGPVRRSVGVTWQAGACRIEDLVKDGRFRKGKISRVLDEILPAEFEAIRERVGALPVAGPPEVLELEVFAPPAMVEPALASASPSLQPTWTLPDTEENLLPLMVERVDRFSRAPATSEVLEPVTPVQAPDEEREPVNRVLAPDAAMEPTSPLLALDGELEFTSPRLVLSEESESASPLMALEGEREPMLPGPVSDEEWTAAIADACAHEAGEEPVTAVTAAPEVQEPDFEFMPEVAELTIEEPRLVPSPIVFDPMAEPPPLPEFFLERAMSEPAPIFHMEEPARAEARSARRATVDEWGLEASPSPRTASSTGAKPPRNLAEAAASLRRSHAAHLLAGLGIPESPPSVLDFGLPTVGDDAMPLDEAVGEDLTFLDEGLEPFEVRVGALGWTGVFRREVESGRPCSLLLRGPQYSFLNMAEPGEPLRGLPLFALFAIGAVSAPGKEALRGGATFIFQGRRASGDWAVEVRPRRRRPAAQASARARS